MDPNASNYDINAVTPGACFYNDTTKVFGCKDPLAMNYNAEATNSGTCYYNDTTKVNVYGCTNPDSYNFNPYATKDNGSCVVRENTFLEFGCTDPSAPNFKPSANRNDGSCRYVYDKVNIVNIKGCMDPLAYNYNGLANMMDHSCLYQEVIIDTATTIVREALKDTIGSVVFDECLINYSLPIVNAYIEGITYVGVDSVMATWIVVQTDGNKTFNSMYKVTETGEQLFVFTVVCSENPIGRTAAASTKSNTFGDVFEILTVTDIKTNASNAAGFSLYPLPAGNSINFSSSETGTLTVISLMGQTVLTTDLNALKGEINLSGLQSGAYVYKFTSAFGQSVGKLIKQ